MTELSVSSKPKKGIMLRQSLLAMIVVSAFSCAYAEEKAVVDLSKVVVTAAGFSQQVKDAPASISVISGSDLTDKPIAGLGDALKDVEGINVERGGKSGGANIKIRGLPSDYTLLMVDGKRLSQNSSGARPNGFGDVDSNFVPSMAAIERIEVVRGPMSTLYGSDAMGGVVNIITKKVPDQWGGEVAMGFIEPESSKFASHMTTSAFAAGPLVKDTLGLAIMGSYDYAGNAKGRFAKNPADVASGEQNGRYNGFSGLGQKKNYNYGGKLSFTPDGSNDIILNYDRGMQRYDNSEEQLGTLNTSIAAGDSGGGYKDKMRFIRDRASISHQGRYDSVTVDSSLLWDTTETIGRLNPVSKPIRAYDSDDRDIKYTNIILDNKWMFALGDHFITTGLQYKHQKLTDSLGAAPLNAKQWQWALFAEDEWTINEALIATFGLRYDKNEDFGNHFSPRVYLTWQVNDAWQVKGGVSRAFRAPDINLMQDNIVGFGKQGALPLIGNPDLKPEKSTSAELGLYFDNDDNFSASATAFYTKFQDKIKTESITAADIPHIDVSSYKKFSPSQYMNVDDAKLYGIELGGRYQFDHGIGLRVNYTYTESSYRNNNHTKQPFSETPRHILNAKVDWQINDAWNVWAEGEYRGKQFNDLNWNNEEIYYKSYSLMNLGAKYTMNDNLSFTAGIYNVLDKKFMDMGDPQVGGKPPKAGADFTNRYKRNEEGRRYWINMKYVF